MSIEANKMKAAFKKMTFFSGIVFLLSAIFLPGFSRIQELRQENNELDRKIANLNRENQSLALEKIKLETDKSYVERLARRKMGIAKKGETIYRILPR